MKILKIEEEEDFEIIIVLSLLSRYSVVIEVNTFIDDKIEFLDNFKCICPELKYKISGQNIEFSPGPLVGGKITSQNITNICHFLKHIIIISPFLRDNITLECNGITNMNESVDMFKVIFFVIFKLFKLQNVEITVKKRGFAPQGQGIVLLKGNSIKSFENINLIQKEQLIKIRGMEARIGADYSNRMVKTIKNTLSDLANTKVHCIINNRNDSGPSPGYECSLSAESKNGLFFYTCSSTSSAYDSPEKMAEDCCKLLLKSIKKGKIFDSKILPYIIMYMGLAKNIGSILVGKLEKESIRMLSLMKQFFNIEYSISQKNTDESVLTIIGCGYKNAFKPL